MTLLVIVLKYNGYNTSAINTNLKYRRSVAAQLAWLACPGSAYLENALHHSNTARYLLVLYINLMLRGLILFYVNYRFLILLSLMLIVDILNPDNDSGDGCVVVFWCTVYSACC